jgi:hypothetical protein
MENKVKHIISYPTVLVLVLFLTGCSARMNEPYDSEKFAAMEVADSIVATEEEAFSLGQDSLNTENIEAFKHRAAQKVQDFADYLELLSDTTVNMAFKDQAEDMAIKLFSSEECKIDIAINSNKDKLPENIREFIQSVRQNAYGIFRVELGKILTSKEIEKTTDSTYKGFFVFSANIIKETAYATRWMVNFEIKKVSKDFGGETKEIWEVYLGDIELY